MGNSSFKISGGNGRIETVSFVCASQVIFCLIECLLYSNIDCVGWFSTL